MRSKNRPSFLEQARRAQFVECAIAALAELGFAGTSIAEVARRAEISKSVVLYHFASKDALLEAVVEHIYTRAAAELVPALERAGTAGEKLDTYLRGCTAFAWEQRTQCQALGEIFRSMRRPDGRPRFTAEENAAMVRAVQAILEDGQGTGEFGPFDAHLMAVVIRAAVDALPGAFDADPALEGPTVADHLVSIFTTATRSTSEDHR